MAGFNVGAFRANMTKDGARANLFEVNLQPPSADSGIVPKIKYMAKAAQLPGSTIGMAQLSYFGRELKFPGNRTFPDWTITIINDEDFDIRNTMERWMAGINSHTSNLRSTQFKEGPLANGYSVDADVYQYGKTGGTPIKSYKFYGMFPIDISPIELDWGTNDAIEEFTVTFAYQYWENVDTEAVALIGNVI